jgi:hypothetical protein
MIRAADNKGRASFCEQKEAKKLCSFGACCFSASGPKQQKLLRRFFQKAATSFLE